MQDGHDGHPDRSTTLNLPNPWFHDHQLMRSFDNNISWPSHYEDGKKGTTVINFNVTWNMPIMLMMLMIILMLMMMTMLVTLIQTRGCTYLRLPWLSCALGLGSHHLCHSNGTPATALLLLMLLLLQCSSSLVSQLNWEWHCQTVGEQRVSCETLIRWNGSISLLL